MWGHRKRRSKEILRREPLHFIYAPLINIYQDNSFLYLSLLYFCEALSKISNTM